MGRGKNQKAAEEGKHFLLDHILARERSGVLVSTVLIGN